eukprot:Colp12_sorted_trinity150504_noHs@3646
MSAVTFLRHMVKDDETIFENLFGVSVVKELFEAFGRRVEVKKVALQSMYSVPWVMNSQSCQCMRCDSSFGVLRWKHHCRGCGFLVCHSCSTSKTAIPELCETAGSRVCKSCHPTKKESCTSIQLEKTLKETPDSPESVTSADTVVEAYQTGSEDHLDLESAFSSE